MSRTTLLLFFGSLAIACGAPDKASDRTRGGAGGSEESSGVGRGGGTKSGSGVVEPETAKCTIAGHEGSCILPEDCTGSRIWTPTKACEGSPIIECCTDDYPKTCDPMLHLFPNEWLIERPGEDGCPPGMIRVTDYCIDKYEASLVYVKPGATRSWSPYFNPGSADVRAVSIENAVPQAYISGVEAGAACEKSKKRLCTDDEWLRACQGPKGFTYPYGNKRETGVCNDHRDVHPAIEYFGTTDSWIYSHLDNACLDQLYESLDRSGQNPGCVTAEGAFDMMGNLHEWTADPAGSFRGGYFVDTVKNGDGCLYVTTAHDSSYWDYSTGFRCCADP